MEGKKIELINIHKYANQLIGIFELYTKKIRRGN